jgi:restriction system protein
MAIPTYDLFIEPILRFLAKHPDGVPAKMAHDAAADALGLSTEEKAQMLTSGTQQIYKNRAGWAHDRLKRAGLSSSPKRGNWRLTPDGVTFVAQHPAPLPPEVVQKLAMDFIGVKLRPATGTDEPINPAPTPPAPSAVVNVVGADRKLTSKPA